MNTLAFEFGRIILTLEDPNDWVFASKLTGKVEDLAPGVFGYVLSTHNMKRIAEQFTGPKKPVVVRGKKFLDELKLKLDNYKQAKIAIQEILSKERYPVEPNGKFIPYAHQTKIVGALLANPFTPVFADCGLGKTGAAGRSIELLIDSGSISKGKILVSAPLSILSTSWEDDLSKFTRLRTGLLWSALTNKAILGEEKVILGYHPEKPVQCVTTKKKTGTYYSRGSEVKETITALDGDGWTKYRASWKVGIDINGNSFPYGEITGKTIVTESTRENFVRSQLERSDVDVYLINHDGVRIYSEILKQHGFQWVIIDESTKIKSPKSKISRAHVDISWKAKRRTILTGTPNPNGFTDLWQQMFFLDRGMTLEPSYKDYLSAYFKPIRLGFVNTPGGRKEAIRYEIRGAQEQEAIIHRIRQVGTCFDQRDCIDLPPRTDTRRLAFMTDEQEAAYDRMARDLVTELRNSKTEQAVGVEAVNVLAKIMKLRQITSGFLIGKDEKIVHLDRNPKWEDLDGYIEELGEKKIVIACQFREEIRSLMERYRDFGAEAIYGDVSVAERTRIVREFQTDHKKRVVLLQPAAAAHGLTLTAASYLNLVSLDFNFEYYFQVAKRIERIGQKSPIFVSHSLACYQDGSETIDHDLMDVLSTKQEGRDALFQNTSTPVEQIAQRLTQRLIEQVDLRNGKR